MTDDRRKVVEFTDPILTFQSCALISKPQIIKRHRKTSSNFRIKTIQQLYESDYQYGVISGSTTERAFKTSTDVILQGMWSKMVSSWPSTFVHSLQEGRHRAEREHYAFILHSPMAAYISMQKPCDFYTTDNFLHQQHYAFALRHSHSLRLRQSFNENIRLMKDTGQLQMLYDRWWKNECDKKRDISVIRQLVTLQPSKTGLPWKYITVTDKYTGNGTPHHRIHSLNLYCVVVILVVNSAFIY